MLGISHAVCETHCVIVQYNCGAVPRLGVRQGWVVADRALHTFKFTYCQYLITVSL